MELLFILFAIFAIGFLFVSLAAFLDSETGTGSSFFLCALVSIFLSITCFNVNKTNLLNSEVYETGYGILREVTSNNIRVDDSNIVINDDFYKKYNFTVEGFGVGDIVKYKKSGRYLVDIEHVLVVEPNNN